MLRISRLADYALVILQALDQHSPHCCSASLLAGETQLTLPTVSKILKRLTEFQILTSIRGTQGGYRLLKSAEQITLAAVIVAIDGDFAMTECCKLEFACQQQNKCHTSHHWQVINRIIYQVLTGVSLADLKQQLNPNDVLMSLARYRSKELTLTV